MDRTQDQLLLRRSEDVAAEGMWRIAAGESCGERWDSLPETQKIWWRSCAMQAIREWTKSHCS